MKLVYYKTKEFDDAVEISNHSAQDVYCLDLKGKNFHIEGAFHYEKTEHGFNRFVSEDIEQSLKEILLKRNLNYFIKHVEGVYSGVVINKNKKTIKVFSDSLERRELYYCELDDKVVISTNLSDLIDERSGYDQNALICALLLTYAPKGHTIYSNIHRIQHNQFVEIIDGQLSIGQLSCDPIAIRQLTDDNLEEYISILENAVLSRASDNLNVVQLSAGWDSTFILSILRKYFNKEQVECVTFHMIQSNGESFNKREVERVKKIADHFQVTCNIVDVDLSAPSIVDFWTSNMEQKVKNEAVLTHVCTHFILSNYIDNKFGEKNNYALFNGECSDSLHNFGFSQGMTMLHDSRAFREYADKMSSYIYSPTFYQKIVDDTYKDDAVYKILKNGKFQKNTPDNRVFEWLFDFVFRKDIKNKFISSDAMNSFKLWTRENYFEKIIQNITKENLYYWLYRIYLDFHLQGTNISKIIVETPNIRMPYYDYNLFKFLASIPEYWGRDLEMNPTKYPIKKIIQSGRYDFPLHLFDKGVSSYTSEFNPGVSWHDEFMRKSNLSDHFFKTVDFDCKIDEMYSSKYFDVKTMKNYIASARDSVIDGIDFNLLLCLTHSK